jgi:hypothetical protein
VCHRRSGSITLAAPEKDAIDFWNRASARQLGGTFYDRRLTSGRGVRRLSTGGKMVDPKVTVAGQMRGTGIEGGGAII